MRALHHWEGAQKRHVTSAALAAVFIFWVFSPSRAHAAAPAVVINEVMWAGSTLSTSDEWIELYNPTTTDVDISGWTLEHTAGSTSPGLTIPSNAHISAGGYYIIGNFAPDHASNAFKVDVDFVTTSISLLNSNNGTVVLKNTEGAAIDQALGTPWPAGESSSIAKKSMEREAEWPDGLLATSWHTSTSSPDQANFGTPRGANSAPPVNTPPVAAISGATDGIVGQSLSWSAEDSSDSDGDTLTYSWSFGDGGSSTSSTANHAYATTGTFSVTLTVSDGNAEAEAVRSVSITAPTYSDSVVINELLPDPAGSDTTGEFIELLNTGAVSLDLAGWQLDDADGGSAPYAIPAVTSIAAGGLRSFSRTDTKIALNNSGDSVRLLDPSGAVRSSYTYSSSVPEGQSYNRQSNGAYVISTTLTPGGANVITAPIEEDDEAESDEETASTSSSGRVAGATAKTVAIADIREEEDGATLTTEGVVSVPPGVLSTREMYLAGSGIQLYFQKGTWPDLKLGDRVQVTGTLGHNRGDARLKIAAAGDIAKKTSGPPPAPHVIATGDIGEEVEGWLVTIQGHVTETSGDTFYVDDGSGDVKVVIRESTKIDKPHMKTDDAVTITGVVSETTSGYRLLPRFQEDVRLGMVAGLTSFPSTGTPGFDLWGALAYLIQAATSGTIGT